MHWLRRATAAALGDMTAGITFFKGREGQGPTRIKG